jgi:hypothetical protein
MVFRRGTPHTATGSDISPGLLMPFSRSRMRLRPILAATCLLAACERADDGAKPEARPADTVAEQDAAPAAPVVLVDTALSAATAGDNGWDYHLRASADLDGDGQPERASLIARVGMDRRGPMWDDGQPWQLYIEEADGTRTYAYRRFVQLGTVEAHVASASSGGAALSILLVENTPQAIRVYEVTYAGPGKVTAAERFTREIHPDRGFAPEHFSH